MSRGPTLPAFPTLTSLAAFQVTGAAGPSAVLRTPEGLDLAAGAIRAGTSPEALEILSTPALPAIPLAIGTAPGSAEERNGGGDFRVPLLGAPGTESPVLLMFAFLLAAAGLFAVAAVPERLVGNQLVARGLAASRVAAAGIGLSLLAGVAAAYLIDKFGS